MKVVFLDIDGVLNHGNSRSAPLATAAEPLPLPIAPECMARLNRLIAETGAKIVISSSWRLFARWQDLGPALIRQGLIAEVIGGTPDLVNDDVWLEHWRDRKGEPFAYEKLERGWEIREWMGRFAMGICSCSHARDLHECDTAECFYNDSPSGASGCLCRQFDGTPLTGVVILDDVSDMDDLKPWLVLTDPKDGLTDPDVERAKWLLERSADGIAAACAQALGTGTPE
jgi:hypothetical protein